MEPKHIIAGFTEDLDLIRGEFLDASPNLKLDDFFTFWKTSHLDCIFTNRFDPRELLESIVEMNKKLVAIVTSELQLLESRLVAWYILFCLAVKQPERFRRKIRMTCNDAIQVNRFCKDVSQFKGHTNASFCWQHLRVTGSIDFVEERDVFGPAMLRSRGSKHVERNEDTRNTDPYLDAKAETREFIQTKLESNLRYLEDICTQYNQMRDILQLDNVNDATVELESKGSVSNCLEQAKSLLLDFKASEDL